MDLRFYSCEEGRGEGDHMLPGKYWYSPGTSSTEERHDVGLEHKDMGRHIIKTPIYPSWATRFTALTVHLTSPS